MAGCIDQPPSSRVGEEDPGAIEAQSRLTRAALAIAERQPHVLPVLELGERDSLALRGPSRCGWTGAARTHIRLQRGAEIESRKRARPTDRQSTLEREWIATQPAAEHTAQVERCVRREAIVA